MANGFQFKVAPDQLWQAINPWTFYQQGSQFGFINIDLGETPHPEIEQAILDEVGSYGRQLGRIGDVVDILVKRLDRTGLDKTDLDALDVLEGQLAAIRQVKRRFKKDEPSAPQ